MRRRRQAQSIFLFLLGVPAVVTGGLGLAPRLAVLAGWQTAEATMQQIRVATSHDGEGYGTFRVSGTYLAPVNGTNTALTCTDGDWSRDFANVTARGDRLRGQLKRKVHFSGEACELAAAGTLSYVGPQTFTLFLGFVLAGAGVYGWLLSRRTMRRCAGCGSALRPYYRYCPECAATIQSDQHPIAV